MYVYCFWLVIHHHLYVTWICFGDLGAGFMQMCLIGDLGAGFMQMFFWKNCIPNTWENDKWQFLFFSFCTGQIIPFFNRKYNYKVGPYDRYKIY